jgi:hypothetical protein
VSVYRQPTKYTVCALPLDHREAGHFSITVEWRGNDKWAVCRYSECLSVDGEWSYEPSTSGRTDEWIAAHRFDLDTALALADRAAPHITVNGYTVEQVRNWGTS